MFLDGKTRINFSLKIFLIFFKKVFKNACLSFLDVV